MVVWWSGTTSAFMFNVMVSLSLITAAHSSCGVPPTYPFAVLDQNYFGIESFTSGSTVSYHCQLGYSKIPRSSNHITCTDISGWSQLQEFCQRKSCGSPGELLNGQVDLEDASFGSTARFSCNEGYRLVGRAERKCQHNGLWSNMVPACEPVICADPPEIIDGTYSGRDKEEFTYQSSVTYYCNSPSLTLIGEPSIFCTEYGNWSGDPPACRDITCPKPVIGHGQITSSFQTLYRHGDTITFRCDYAFIINGSTLAECGIDGRWLPKNPACLSRESCPEPVLENGEIKGVKDTYKSGLEVGYKVYSRIEFHCNFGYSLSPRNAKTAYCRTNLQWNTQIPTCKAWEGCPEPEIANGSSNRTAGSLLRSGFEYKVGSSLEFSCNPGYVLIGEKKSSCQMDNRWSPEIPTCKARESCPVPMLNNGYVISGSPQTFKSGLEIGYRSRVEIMLQCHPGHIMEGSSAIYCGADLKWNPAVPTCVKNVCPVPEVQNGFIALINGNLIQSGFNDKHEYIVFESVTFECYPGYTMNRMRSVSCTPELNWMPPLPTCKPLPGDCGIPPLINNTKLKDEYVGKEMFPIGSMASYVCDETKGYTKKPGMSDTITCGYNSTWSIIPQFCERLSPTPFKEEPQEQTEDCSTFSGLCNAVEKKINEPFEEAKLESYKTLLEMKKLCLEIIKLKLEIFYRTSFFSAPSQPQSVLPARETHPRAQRKSDVGWAAPLRDVTAPGSPPRPPPLPEAERERKGKSLSDAARAGALLSGSREESFCPRRPSCCPGGLGCGSPFLPCAGVMLYPRRTCWCFAAAFLLVLNVEVQGDCGIPPPRSNAVLKDEYVDKETFPIGSTASYVCDLSKNYGKIPGKSDTISCQSDSTWTVIDEFCELTCDIPTRFDFGEPKTEFIEMNTFPVGTNVTYNCRPGYLLIRGKPTSIVCLQNLTWSTIDTFCERKSCGSPGELINGNVDLEDNLFGSTATFSCNAGYRLLGRPIRQCLSTGFWSNVVPSCEAVICGSPPGIENGIHSGMEKDEFNYLSSVTYRCNNASLHLIGQTSIHCTQYGNWSGIPPKCKVVSCADPIVQNGKKITGFGHTYTYAQSVQFKCNPGFKLVGKDMITCGEDSNWNPPIPACKVATASTTAPVPGVDDGTTASTTAPVSGVDDGTSTTAPVPGVDDGNNTSGSNSALIGGILGGLFCLVVLGAVCYVCKKKNEGVYDTNESRKDVPLNPKVTPTSQSVDSDKKLP
uniref:Complement receptor type 1-like n=1 Tax=Geotrypetes seraphini TaxID=260995 RepID=A0A6P8NUB8_GEOSA|nr:complement receptor type 1-like [Geotrypetes seraphini]